MKSKMNSKKTFSSEWIIQFRKKYGKYKKTQIYQTFKTERKINYFVLEPNYHTRKCFSKTLLAIEMIKTKLFTNKKNLSILDTSKMAMSEFWYDSIIPIIMLHGFGQFYRLHNNKRYLRKHWRRCQNKIWCFKL